MVRRIILATFSLFLLVAAAMWARSHFSADALWQQGTLVYGPRIESSNGELSLQIYPDPDNCKEETVECGFLGLGYYYGPDLPPGAGTFRYCYVVTVPYRFIALAILVPIVCCGVSEISQWRQRRRTATGRCAACGYDMWATPERCPECGTVSEKLAEISD
jgi:hypothetical protein